MTRIIRKDYSNDDFGVFRCIAHKEMVVNDLFIPFIVIHSEFTYNHIITIGKDTSCLIMAISNNWKELEKLDDTTGSTGNTD